MNIALSDHFDYKRLFMFILPSIVMMVFTSIYGVVDGYFVSNYAGKSAFAAVNLIMPFIMIVGGLGFMFGTGGSALVAKTLGEGKNKKACEIFTLIVLTAFIVGIVCSFVSILFIRPVTLFLGATGNMVSLCIRYGRIVLFALPMFMLQNMFQSFLITAEKPNLGLIVTLIAGVTNMVLDYLLVGVFRWGVEGAALATSISQLIGGIIPVFYFISSQDCLLRFVKPKMNLRALFHTCTNGSSELVTNISISVVSVLYNFQLIEYAGENGIAAYGVLMYVNFIFIAIFIGYSIGSAPIIGYNYGAQNHKELKNVFRKSMIIMSGLGIALTLLSLLLAKPMALLFVGYDQILCDMTYQAFMIYSYSFFFCGFGIFSSSLFTALNNGVVSALLSGLRTLVFQVLCIMIIPKYFGLNGIWCSVIVAEGLACIISFIFIFMYKNKYKY